MSKSDCSFDTFVVEPYLLKLFKAVSVNTKSRLSGLYLVGLRNTMLHNLS